MLQQVSSVLENVPRAGDVAIPKDATVPSVFAAQNSMSLVLVHHVLAARTICRRPPLADLVDPQLVVDDETPRKSDAGRGCLVTQVRLTAPAALEQDQGFSVRIEFLSDSLSKAPLSLVPP